MIISNKTGSGTYALDLAEWTDISIPLKFNGPQPNAFGVEPASSTACEYGDLVGDTRSGGSCNFEQVTLIPHCNGTHTECVGHITNERISIRECLTDVFISASLISVEPVPAAECDESYAVAFGPDDRLITRQMIESGASKRAVRRSCRSDFAKQRRKADSRLHKFDGTVLFNRGNGIYFIYRRKASACRSAVDRPSIRRRQAIEPQNILECRARNFRSERGNAKEQYYHRTDLCPERSP